MYHLCMLYTPAQIGFVGVLRKRRLVNVEKLPIRPIADALDCHLVVVFNCELRRCFYLLDRDDIQAVTARHIGVRFQQPAAVCTKRTVQDFFTDAAHREEVVAVADHAIVIQAARHVRGLFLECHVQPHGQVAFVGHRLQQIDLGERRPKILERGNAVT